MAALDEEQGWIRQVQAGDLDAFGPVITRYQRMVHSLAYRMSGSEADAQDLAQEIFIRAYQQLGSFRQEARFSTWLYRLAVNTCLNWLKRDRRRGDLHRAWGEETAQAEVHASAPPPPDPVARQVGEALQALSPKQRAAIVLTIYDGLSHAEAARVLGCSETTVSWRVFAARARLKKFLRRRSLE